MGERVKPPMLASPASRHPLIETPVNAPDVVDKDLPLKEDTRLLGRVLGDVLRAQLCQGPKGQPVYVLTLLPPDGKVTRMTIDAKSGDMIDGNTGTVMSGSR